MLDILMITGGEVFSPRHIGRADIVAAGGRTLAVGSDLSGLAGATHIAADGMRVIPGLIDQHLHFLGGGDGNGISGRVAELDAATILAGGTTTAVGVLGVETVTRGLLLLLRKTHELRAAGLSAFMYTAGMPLPAENMLGTVFADVSLIDQVIGAKTAISEALHPNADPAHLPALAGELMRARAMTGKAAVLHCHIGGLASGLEPLFGLHERFGMPLSQVLPTHVNRIAAFSPVFEHAIRFTRMGGTIDMTACVSQLDGNPTGVDVPDAVRLCLERGVPIGRISFSSDANIPVAKRDAEGAVIGYRVAPSDILYRDLMRLVHEAGLPLETALLPVTENPARILGLSGRKGAIRQGHDADYVVIDEQDHIRFVIAGGKIVFRTD
ncbi:amidohydrolase family protein [Martelella sp. AMO21009]